MPKLDIACLGAFNIDFLAPLPLDLEELPPAIAKDYLNDDERPTSELNDFEEAVREVRAAGLEVTEAYGGSALNTARAIARLDPTLSVGIAACIGVPPSVSAGLLLDPERQIVADGLAHACLKPYAGPSGACLAVLHGARRGLRTYYSDEIPKTLLRHADEIAAFLAHARMVHISSILGDEGPSAIWQIVERIDRKSNEVIFSVDPGADWARRVDSDIDIQRILGRAQFIFANTDESKSLGSPFHEEEAQAAHAATRFESTLLIVKDWTATRLIGFGDPRISDLIRQEVLPPSRIADSTGAGDVFAAGFLAALAGPRSLHAAAAGLGMAAARRRIQHLGDAGYAALSDLLAGAGDSDPGSVFVSHAYRDRRLAHELVELIEGAGVPYDRIFCTSVRDTAVAAGRPIVGSVLAQLLRSRLVIFLVSEAFVKSTFCRYEVGATWALGKENVALCVPPLKPSRLDLLMNGQLNLEATDPESLDLLRDRLVQLELAHQLPMSTAHWSRRSKSFVKKAKGAR